jgi:hypothetical protein
MATVRIADLVTAPAFFDTMAKLATEKSALLKSGIMTKSGEASRIALAEGNDGTMRYWNDLTGDASIPSDDPAIKLVPGNANQSSLKVGKISRVKGWSTMDIASNFTGNDPALYIASRQADYWVREDQKTLIASLTGIFVDNAANNSGDMIWNIATDAVGAPSAAEKISATAILSAKQTMGDAADKLTTMIMHSAVYTELQKQSLIAFIPNDKANIGFGSYLGYSVIVDDTCPAIMGANRITYTTYICGAGAIGYGEGRPKTPQEVVRDALAGNGSGEETLLSRRIFVMHPMGFNYAMASQAGLYPTNVELALDANWSRSYDRKHIGLVAIKTNG